MNSEVVSLRDSLGGECDGGESDKVRILVVDDENGPRQALRMLLKKQHDVLLAQDVPSAIEI
ncbi:MAG: Response regulator, partial [Candidatus Hydrogenedentes bacterium]|nr:Response regulator [Candidatus Hydrogenedentota bacterium]